MTSKPVDDFDALRLIVDALKPFEPKDQERIIRWAREKIGLASSQSIPPHPGGTTSITAQLSTPSGENRPKDIRSFIEVKNPQSDNQFAAAVAYYYRFEAPENERKTEITPDDVQDATRRAGRDRLMHPAQTLINAHGQGYFDKVDRGRYVLSTVGENLVAMALPQGAANTSGRQPRNKRRGGKSKAKRGTIKKKK